MAGGAYDETLTASPELEELRAQLLRAERKLAKYGFDPRRGVESYSVRELERLLKGAGDEEDAHRLLLTVVELQEEFYRRLYSLVGLRELDVDTDTPERRLARIKRWLLRGRGGLDGLPARGGDS